MEYAWISNLLRDTAFKWRPRELSCTLKKWLILGDFANFTVLVLVKLLPDLNVYFLEGWIHDFVAKLGNRYFCWFPATMLVPLRWASTYKALQIYVKLSPNISHIKNCTDLNSGEGLCIFTLLHSLLVVCPPNILHKHGFQFLLGRL